MDDSPLEQILNRVTELLAGVADRPGIPQAGEAIARDFEEFGGTSRQAADDLEETDTRSGTAIREPATLPTSDGGSGWSEDGPRDVTDLSSGDAARKTSTVDSAKPAAARVPNLHGKSLEEAEAELANHGFLLKSETAGGYREYANPDDSVIWIRPNGEVQRLGPKIDPGPNQKNYSPRYDREGNVTQEHSTGERVVR